jgi:hypothetical protein
MSVSASLLDALKFASKSLIATTLLRKNANLNALVHELLEDSEKAYATLRPIRFEMPERVRTVVNQGDIPDAPRGHPEFIPWSQKFGPEHRLAQRTNEVR